MLLVISTILYDFSEIFKKELGNQNFRHIFAIGLNSRHFEDYCVCVSTKKLPPKTLAIFVFKFQPVYFIQ